MKPENYSTNLRGDLIPLIPSTAQFILDIGCGAGMTGKFLKGKGVKEVVGVELDSKAAQTAQKYLDKVFVGNVENEKFPLKKNHFDCIICADIIEHLKSPSAFLKKYQNYLKEGGSLLISVPNVQFYYVILSLLRGKWQYTNRGIFDRTHIRFFTLNSINQLLEEEGFKTETIKRNYRLFEPYCAHQNLAKIVSLYFFRNFFTFQYLIRAVKK